MGCGPFYVVSPWRRMHNEALRQMPLGPDRDELLRRRRCRAADVGSRCAELKRAKASGDDERLSKAIDDVTAVCDSEERLERLLYATKDVKPEVFWPAWLGWWSATDFSGEFHGILPGLFRSKGSALPYLDEMQRAHYDALPRKITVYRGCDFELTGGVSWTVSRKVAEFFAGGGRYGPPIEPVVVKGIIDKRSPNFFFCCDDRNEAEIVCWPDKIVSVTEHCIEPPTTGGEA